MNQFCVSLNYRRDIGFTLLLTVKASKTNTTQTCCLLEHVSKILKFLILSSLVTHVSYAWALKRSFAYTITYFLSHQSTLLRILHNLKFILLHNCHVTHLLYISCKTNDVRWEIQWCCFNHPLDRHVILISWHHKRNS